VGAAFLVNFLRFLLVALWLLILIRVLLSWVDPTGRNRFSAFVIQTTEPLLAPVRRLLPRTGMFDFSALIVLLVLGALMRYVA
jgi:YggT family protein